MATTISPAEIERYKVERLAELDFYTQLTALVNEYKQKVSPKNAALRSMQRFLKASV